MKKKAWDYHTRSMMFPCAGKILLKAKLTFLISLFSFLGTIASESYSQTTTLSLELKNETIENILGILEAKSEFYFLYSAEMIDVNRKVNINVSNSQIEKILDLLFEGTNTIYAVEGRQIVLSPGKERMVAQQPTSISGRVTDFSGAPLQGVAVVMKSTSHVTVTDANGSYSIPSIPGDATLVFSFVGMETQEIAVSGKTSINVVMVEASIGIEEVVVIGYGTMKKKDVTGSITQISADDLTKNNSPNISSALQGKIPAAVSSTWRPGVAPSIEIRGISSITGNNDPLWVVDGIPMQSSSAHLNPNDIQSIDILKDASASAIYGARGSNGVIIVTTKRAESGETDIKASYSGWTGFDKVTRYPELLNGREYADFKRASYVNAGITDEASIFDPVELASIATGTDTDWFELLWSNSAFSTSHNLTFNASGKKMGSMLTLGYLDQGSLIETAGYRRYSLNFNNVFNLTERLKLTTALLGSFSKYDTFDESVRHAYYVSPLGTAYDENGERKVFGNPAEALVTSPLFEIANTKNTTDQYGLIGSAALEWKIFDELTYRFSAGMDLTSAAQGVYYGGNTRNRLQANGQHSAGYQSSTTLSNVVDNVLSYNKNFNQNHHLNVMAAFNIETYQYKTADIDATDFYFDGLWYNLDAASTVLGKRSELSEWGIMSLMGRANYSLFDRYLFTFTYRHDGSSRLSSKNKWAGFPSMSVAWRLSDELFLGSIKEKFLDDLKLRLSWGNTGNTNVKPYATLGLLSKTYYSWGETAAIGTIPTGIPNPDLKWEKLEEYNLGIDLGLFKHRLTGSIDLYNRTTRDLILSRLLPATSGFTEVTQNIGKTRNRGIELMLKGDVIRTKELTWNVGATFFKNKNEILDLYRDKSDDVGSGWFIGHPVRVNYMLDFVGIWQEEEAAEAAQFGAQPGHPKYRDINNPAGSAPSISLEDDRYILSKEPKWIGGLNTSLNYKGFDFYLSLYTRQGVRDVSEVHTMTAPKHNQIKMNYWTPENRSNTAPQANNNWPYPNILNSDYFVRNLSFIRLSNISLGYTLPQKLTDNLKIEKARAYININNPYVWSSYNGQDPESTIASDYPAISSFQLGLNLNF